jgi:transposase-like protein
MNTGSIMQIGNLISSFQAEYKVEELQECRAFTNSVYPSDVKAEAIKMRLEYKKFSDIAEMLNVSIFAIRSWCNKAIPSAKREIIKEQILIVTKQPSNIIKVNRKAAIVKMLEDNPKMSSLEISKITGTSRSIAVKDIREIKNENKPSKNS